MTEELISSVFRSSSTFNAKMYFQVRERERFSRRRKPQLSLALHPLATIQSADRDSLNQ